MCLLEILNGVTRPRAYTGVWRCFFFFFPSSFVYIFDGMEYPLLQTWTLFLLPIYVHGTILMLQPHDAN